MGLSFGEGEVTYTWVGGFGAQFTSDERGVRQGDVRMIQGQLFYAYQVLRRSWRRTVEVSWCRVDELTAEGIRELKQKIFGL